MPHTDKETYHQMIQRWYDHAQLRAMERYGISYSSDVQAQIRSDHKKNVFNKLMDIPNSNRVVLRGRILDNVVTFIYSIKHNVVITFLHNNWVSTDTSEFYMLSSNRRKPKAQRKNSVSKGGKVNVNMKAIRKAKAPRLNKYQEEIDEYRD